MEMELLTSKTELMTLNNQLLEAVQHRLELSLELEAWKVCYGQQFISEHTNCRGLLKNRDDLQCDMCLLYPILSDIPVITWLGLEVWIYFG